MKKVFEKISYVAPSAEMLCLRTPLSILNGGSGEVGAEPNYGDSGELEDATSFDDRMNHGN